MSHFLPSAGAGLVFGAALLASGVYAPDVIRAQMRLQDFHMLTVFLVASGSSALVMALFEKWNIAERKPNPNSSLGWFGPYDANIIGGGMIGIGMATTGACPGTVLVQLATGVSSGKYVMLGGVLGAMLFVHFGQSLKCKPSASTSTPPAPRSHSLQDKFDIKPDHLLLAYEAMCVLVIGGAVWFGLDGASAKLHPVFGGVLIGFAQATSLLLRGNPLGVSTAYEEVGKGIRAVVASKPYPPMAVTPFALGIIAGSFMLAQWIPSAMGPSDVSKLGAVVGGCVMVFGARLARGCTSGHGISGMSVFSISSIISVAAMFGGGIATAMIVG